MNSQVQAAAKNRKQARVDAKVKAINDETEAILGEAGLLENSAEEREEGEAADSLIEVGQGKGFVEITIDGRLYKVPTVKRVELIEQGVAKAGRAFKKAMPGRKKLRLMMKKLIDKVVEAVIEEIKSSDEYLSAVGEAQGSTHHELVAFRDDWDNVFGRLVKLSNRLMDTLNSRDPVDTRYLAGGVLIEEIADAANTKQMGALVSLLGLLSRVMAYYDPNVGLSSLFTQQAGIPSYNAIGTPNGGIRFV